MVASGLCTKNQAKCGVEELHWRMAHYYESNSNSSGPSTAAELLDEGNEWSTYSEVVQVIETPM